MFPKKSFIVTFAFLILYVNCQEVVQLPGYLPTPYRLTSTGFYVPLTIQDIEALRHRRAANPALDLDVTASKNLWQSRDGRSNLDAYANYNRHYGSPGTTRPNYGAGITFNHRF